MSIFAVASWVFICLSLGLYRMINPVIHSEKVWRPEKLSRLGAAIFLIAVFSYYGVWSSGQIGYKKATQDWRGVPISVERARLIGKTFRASGLFFSTFGDIYLYGSDKENFPYKEDRIFSLAGVTLVPDLRIPVKGDQYVYYQVQERNSLLYLVEKEPASDSKVNEH